MFQKKVTRFFTRNGQEVVPVMTPGKHPEFRTRPYQRTRADGSVAINSDIRYIQVQIQPPVPQRFEWVREDNLRVRRS